MNRDLSFRRYVEEMDAAFEKKVDTDRHEDDEGQTMDYFAGLGDEMKIKWKDMKKAFEAEPWTSASFTLGSPGKEIGYKTAAWEIVPGTLSPNGASIRLKPQDGDRTYLKGNRLNKGEPDTKIYHLNRKELQAFMTGGWAPAVQAAQGGGAAAAPGLPPA